MRFLYLSRFAKSYYHYIGLHRNLKKAIRHENVAPMRVKFHAIRAQKHATAALQFFDPNETNEISLSIFLGFCTAYMELLEIAPLEAKAPDHGRMNRALQFSGECGKSFEFMMLLNILWKTSPPEREMIDASKVPETKQIVGENIEMGLFEGTERAHAELSFASFLKKTTPPHVWEPDIIKYYEIASARFSENGEEFLGKLTRLEIGRYLSQSPITLDNPDSVEYGISILEEFVDDLELYEEKRDYLDFMTRLGAAYLNRTVGDRRENKLQGLNYYKTALSVPTSECDPEMLAEAHIKYAEALSDTKHDPLIPDAEECIFEAIENAILLLEPYPNSQQLHFARFIFSQLQYQKRLIDRELHLKKLKSAISSAKKIGENSRTYGRLLYRFTGENLTFFQKTGDLSFLEEAKSSNQLAIDVFKRANDPINAIGAMAYSGFVSLLEKDWLAANSNYDAIFSDTSILELFRQSAQATKELIHGSSTTLNYAPFAAAAAGDAISALWRHEILNLRHLRNSLENTNYLRFHPDQDQHEEGFYGKTAEGRLTQEGVDFLDNLEMNQSSRTYLPPDKTEFESKLNLFLKQSPDFILIPLLAIDHSCCVLFRPNSNISDVIISPVSNYGMKSLLSDVDSLDQQADNYLNELTRKDKDNQRFGASIGVAHKKIMQVFGQWLQSVVDITAPRSDVRIIVNNLLNSFPMALAGVDNDLEIRENLSISICSSISVLMKLNEKSSQRSSLEKSINFVEGAPELLPTARYEKASISKHFNKFGHGFNEASHLHIIAHGKFDGLSPLESRFQLTEDKFFTLAHAKYMPPLQSLRLVTVSACEVGAMDVADPYNESESFTHEFLRWGASAIVAALWRVSDQATLLLMVRFYEFHIGQALPPPQALHQAQQWLANATAKELAQYALEICGNTGNRDASIQCLLDDLDACVPEETRFAHPIFWAGFYCYGI